FFFYDPCAPVFYTLSLHDALPISVALLWQWILDPNFGLINTFLENIGMTGPGWLTDEAWSKPSLILMNLWAVGGTMIIYLAGLQDRKSTRLNSSHVKISYAVFCLK